MSKKIIVYSNTAWSIFNFRRNLIMALLDAGHEVVAVAPPDAYSELIKDIGCQYIPLIMDNKGTSILRDISLLRSIRKILKEHQFDLAFTFTIKCNLYTCFAATSLPVLVTPNVSGLGTVFLSDSWLKRFVCLLYRIAFRRSKIVFFQNANDQDLFQTLNLIKPSQGYLLPGSGVNLKYFAPAKMNERKNLTFLLLARLLWDKGVGEYVEAAIKVKEKYPGTKFQILGFLDSENNSAIDRVTVNKWVEEGIIEYLGTTSDVRPYIMQSDCIVLPSYYPEGTPRTLLEASAMARPIITTDTPGCRDVIEDNISGFLCEPRDAKDLAEKMEHMIEMGYNARLKMGQESRKRSEKKYDEKIVIDAYFKALSGT